MLKKGRRHIKFIQPSVEGLYPRERLLSRLNSALQARRCIWVKAPPGAGKTSLATLCAARHKGQVIWFRVESSDRNVATFITNLYLAAGLKVPHAEPFKDDFDSLLDALHNVAEHLTPDTLWVWESCEHFENDSSQLQSLAEIMRHSPVFPLMLFNSREPPASAFRRPELAHRMEILGWPELRLDREESDAISKLISPLKQPQQLAHWHSLSNGWVAALVMLAQGSNQQQNRVNEQTAECFAYFADELLHHMEPAQQQRLMQLAVLPYIPVEVAREVLQDPAAAGHLEKMVERWHLVEVSEEKFRVYRLHPLLKRFMQEQLDKRLTADSVNQLRRRCADSLERHGLLEEAIELRQQAADWTQMLRLVLGLAESMVASGRNQVLQVWLQEIPQAVAETTPWHGYWLGLCLRFENRDLGWPLLETAFTRFRVQAEMVGQYAAWLALAEAMLVVFEDLNPLKRWLTEYDALRQRHPRCPDMALKLKSLTLAGSIMSILRPKDPRLARLIRVAEIGVRLVPFRVPRQAAFTYLIMHYANTGQIARMHAMARQLLPGLDEEGLPGPLRLFGHAMIGLHQIIAGEETPEKILKSAIKLSNHIGGGLFSTIPRSYLIYYDTICGLLPEAKKQLQQLEQITPPNHRMYQAANDFMAAWLCVAEGDTGRGLELSALSKSMCRQIAFDFGRALNTSLRAQTLAQLQRHAEARAELDELAQLADESSSQLLTVMHGLGQTWLACRQNDREAAARILARTLVMAERESIMAYPGLLRPVTAELALLACEHHIAEGFIQRLVQRWGLTPKDLSQLHSDWPWPVRVRTLGRFEVQLGETRLGLEQSSHSRPLELLAALIALGRFQVSKSALCDQLWPDTEADKAHHALDNLIYRLRKLIGSESILISNSLISLDDSRVWVDVWSLEALVESLKHDNAQPAQAAERLLRLYRGDFLSGQEQLWITPARERIRSRYIQLAEQLGLALIAQTECDKAIGLWEQALSHEPLNEGLYLQLMKCLAKSGRPADAHRVYLRCRDALQHQLGMEPGDAIQDYARSLVD